MTKDLFLSEALFAKLVSTPQGPGILVAGNVYHIVCPNPGETDEVTEAFVAALRSGPHISSGVVGLTPGRIVSGLANAYATSSGSAA